MRLFCRHSFTRNESWVLHELAKTADDRKNETFGKGLESHRSTDRIATGELLPNWTVRLGGQDTCIFLSAINGSFIVAKCRGLYVSMGDVSTTKGGSKKSRQTSSNNT